MASLKKKAPPLYEPCPFCGRQPIDSQVSLRLSCWGGGLPDHHYAVAYGNTAAIRARRWNTRRKGKVSK